MDVVSIRTAGLGDSTYLLHHDGSGVLVDPQRDVGRFLAAAERVGADIRFVLETHVHNDYVSGGRQSAVAAGAELVLPAAAGAAFPHTPAFHGEDLEHGGIVVRPLHTPGHTPEHTSYLVCIDGEPMCVFTGGSLLVGSAGRTDLMGRHRASQLARLQLRSVRRLATLPGHVVVYPTHGAGSFCTAAAAVGDTSTIGAERDANPVLSYRDDDDFVQAHLAALQPFPSYYAHMGPINLNGPEPLPALSVPELTARDLARLPGEVRFVDARPRREYAAGHVPGALGIELREDFGTWVGWLVPFDCPLILVLAAGQDHREPLTQLARIGFDRVVGVMRGVDQWRLAGRPVAAFATASVADLFARRGDPDLQVLDVRSRVEWEQQPWHGAVHRYLPDVVDDPLTEFDSRAPVWVICASGYRASAAGGLLERKGLRPVVVADGGVADLRLMRQRPLAFLP